MTSLDTRAAATREHPPPPAPRHRLPVGGGLVVAALAAVNVLVAIGYPAAPLAFPVVVLLPGALTLVALGGARRRGWDWLLHAVAFSLLVLMGVGAVLALLPGPALTAGPALAGFDVAAAILGGAAWWRRRNTVAGPVRAHARLTPGRRTTTPRLLIRAWRRGSGTGTGGRGAVLGPWAGVVAVALAVAGAQHLNRGGTPWIAAAGLAAAVVAFAAAVAAARRQGTVAAASTVYLAALAVLFATSLRGDVVTGHDIKIEYRVFLDTFATGSWQPGGRYPGYNSCLSLTVLPSMLAHLLGVAPLDVFRVLYQLIFALVPVGALLVARRLLRPAHAVLAAVLVVAFPTFVNDMPMLNRQEIALIFFVVLLPALLDARVTPRHRATVIVLAAAGLTVSHYSSAAIAAALLVLAAAVRLFRLAATPPARTHPPAAVPRTAPTAPAAPDAPPAPDAPAAPAVPPASGLFPLRIPGEHHVRLHLRRAAPSAVPSTCAAPTDVPRVESRSAGDLLVGVSTRLYRRRSPRESAPPGLYLAAVAVSAAVLGWSGITGSAATFAADLVATARAVGAGAAVQSDSTRYGPSAARVPVDDVTALRDYAAALVATRVDEGAPPAAGPVVPELLPAEELPVTRLGALLDAAGLDPGHLNAAVRRGVVLLFEVGAVLGCAALWWRLRPVRRRSAAVPSAGLAEPSAEPLAMPAGEPAGEPSAVPAGERSRNGGATRRSVPVMSGRPAVPARGVVAAQLAATAAHGPVARGRAAATSPSPTGPGAAAGESSAAGTAPGVGAAGGGGKRARPVWRPAAPVLAELAMAGVLLLGLSLAVPQITDSYGLLRIYQQLLPVLAIAVITLLVAVARRVFRGRRAGVDVAVTVVVLGCLLTVTGLLPRATGGYAPQLNLAAAGPYQRAYLAGPADAAAAAAVGRFLPVDAVVVADSRDAVNLRALAGLAPVEGIAPGAVPADAYLLVRPAGGGRLTATAVVGDRVIGYRLPVDAVAAGRPVVLVTGSHVLYGPVRR
jgi:hypothetical protein